MIQRWKHDMNGTMTTDPDGEWVEYKDADYWKRLAEAAGKVLKHFDLSKVDEWTFHDVVLYQSTLAEREQEGK